MLTPLRARVVRGLLKYPPRPGKPLRWSRTCSMLTPDDLAELQRLARDSHAANGPHGWQLTARGRKLAETHGLMDTGSYTTEDADLGAARPVPGRVPVSKAQRLPARKPKPARLTQDDDGQLRFA